MSAGDSGVSAVEGSVSADRESSTSTKKKGKDTRMDVDRCSLYLLGLLDGCGQMQSISPGSPAPDGCGQMQSISPGPLGWIWTDAVYIYSTDYNSTEERRMRMIKYNDLATPRGSWKALCPGPALVCSHY